jgi:hypothetical protein
MRLLAQFQVGRTRLVVTPVPDRWSPATECGLLVGPVPHCFRNVPFRFGRIYRGVEQW